jgi:hypothetical protein
MTPTGEEIRAYLRRMFNNALRKPDMHGGEMALRLYLDALAFANGQPDTSRDIETLRKCGAFSSTGVQGAFRALLPGLESSHKASLDTGLDTMAASVYAEIGRRQGWTELDRALTPEEHAAMSQALGDWCTLDRSMSDLLEAFGSPSLLSGGSNPRYPKTLIYAGTSPEAPCLSFHVWNSFEGMYPRTRYPEPMLLAVRREGGTFAGSFTFAPLGQQARRGLTPAAGW